MKFKKKGKDSRSGTSRGWEVVFTGFVLILLCFFIMLCSFSTMEQSKISRFVKSFNLAVNIFSGGLKLEKGEIILPESNDIVEAQSELADIFRDVAAVARQFGVLASIDLLIEEQRLVMRLSEAVLFEKGSAEIMPGSLVLLQEIGIVLSKSSLQISIEGHTDDLPIHTKRYPSNWELSTARAVTVLRFFVGQCGVSPAQISAIGFGQYRPLVPNSNKANRAKNRRVEIIVQNG